ncbi:MAG: hypothetical protein HUU37_06615 [Bdellovibrionales bacterium]|nr:hypothetical protein [Bdellovibrionales bacterium]
MARGIAGSNPPNTNFAPQTWGHLKFHMASLIHLLDLKKAKWLLIPAGLALFTYVLFHFDIDYQRSKYSRFADLRGDDKEALTEVLGDGAGFATNILLEYNADVSVYRIKLKYPETKMMELVRKGGYTRIGCANEANVAECKDFNNAQTIYLYELPASTDQWAQKWYWSPSTEQIAIKTGKWKEFPNALDSDGSWRWGPFYIDVP